MHASAKAAAYDATVSTLELEDALKAARVRDVTEAPARRAAAAAFKVEKARAALADAEAELKAATAALEG